jgi:hypothetical protein
MSNAMNMPVIGGAPETEIARHIAKLAMYSAPLLVFFGFVFWGFDGVASVLFAIVLVVANFLASAAIMSVTAKISLAMLMGGAMFGFLIRFGVISLAVILVKDQPWVELIPLGLTLIVTHLGLLFWELHYVSATLAYPGLKPSSKPAKKKD